eukprot:gene8630-8811_t
MDKLSEPQQIHNMSDSHPVEDNDHLDVEIVDLSDDMLMDDEIASAVSISDFADDEAVAAQHKALVLDSQTLSEDEFWGSTAVQRAAGLTGAPTTTPSSSRRGLTNKIVNLARQAKQSGDGQLAELNMTEDDERQLLAEKPALRQLYDAQVLHELCGSGSAAAAAGRGGPGQLPAELQEYMQQQTMVVDELLRHFWQLLPVNSTEKIKKFQRIQKSMDSCYEVLNKVMQQCEPGHKAPVSRLVKPLFEQLDLAGVAARNVERALSSKGQGKATVVSAMPKYALVTGANRGQEVAAGLAKDKGESEQLKVVPLDTGDRNSIKQLAQLVEKEYNQQIDLLATFDQTVKVNVAGPVQLSHALLPLLAPGALVVMVSSGLGAQANISPDYQQAVQAVSDVNTLTSAVPFLTSSPMGFAPPGQGGMSPTYSVAKAMLNRAVQLLSEDSAFQARGVSVVSTCPGWCRTDMGTAAADRSAEQGGSSVLWPFFNWDKALAGSFTRDGQRLQW